MCLAVDQIKAASRQDLAIRLHGHGVHSRRERAVGPTLYSEDRRWLSERLSLYNALSTRRAVPIRWMRAFHMDYFFACGEPLLPTRHSHARRLASCSPHTSTENRLVKTLRWWEKHALAQW